MRYINLNKVFKIDQKRRKDLTEIQLKLNFPVCVRLNVFQDKDKKLIVYSEFKNSKFLAYIIAALYFKSKKSVPKQIIIINKKKRKKYFLIPDLFYSWNDVINQLTAFIIKTF